MLLDLFGKITYYLLTPAKRMTAHFYEHFLIPRTEAKRTTAMKSTNMALLVVQTQLFPSSKSEPQKQRKIIEWTIHLEARKSAFLTFQKAQKKIDFFSDYAFVCNANENRFFEMGSKNFVIWSSGPSGKVQSVSGTIQNQLIWFRNVCCKTY